MSVGIKFQSRYRGLDNLGRNLAFRDAALSPTFGTSIWELIPLLASMDPAVAFQAFDDFMSLALDDTTGNPSGFKWVSDSATGAITLPKVAGGVVNIACGIVDNNETYIQLGGAGLDTPAPFSITDLSNKPLAFQVRAKALEHADVGIFVGLAEEGSAAANFLTDNSGVVADKDFVGFNILTATPAAWNVTWKKAGQAVQAVAAAAVNADDWHTFAFIFDGVHTVYFWIDGVLVSTQALSSAATFPSAQLLAPIFGLKTGEGVVKNLQVDYYKVWQAR